MPAFADITVVTERMAAGCMESQRATQLPLARMVQQPLDRDGIDALMDSWNPARKEAWARLGVHAAWRTVRFQPRSSADSTRAFGAVRL